MMLFRSLAVAAALAYTTAAGASGLDQLHAFLTETKTSKGTFTQSVASKTRPAAQKSSGTFAFQRPGKFRWTYDKPFEQLIVGDGARVWVYDRDLNQVVVRKLDVALGATPAALLAGDNALEKNFTLIAGAVADGLEYVDATPKTPESQFTRVRIGFRDNLPRRMELTDAFGQITTLDFASVERNPTLAATQFRFDVPSGADVVGDAGAK
ncbi:MAG: outer membrane lipoprotein chaperone LolA [Betaproteobacteria bacterium]|nr:MAG: outer membrane lipoprotein chaperone LolA [Betaproteobacteria bacterium]TMH63193.1 MAG: outer membrane lipoprotein chaperone LolA [Betaproteobacteria bacterium]